MKVKLKKRKKSSAPGTVEQAKIESPIKILRKNARTYVVPVQLFPDRGYRHVVDLVEGMRKTKEKKPAPITAEEAKEASTIEKLGKNIGRYGFPRRIVFDDYKPDSSKNDPDLGRQFHYWLDECTKQVIKKAKENIEKIKAEIKAKKKPESPHSKFLTTDIGGRGHRAAKNSESYNAFMTSEQKKQVADALVSFVSRTTGDSHYLEQEEIAILPAILDFLAETDSSKE